MVNQAKVKETIGERVGRLRTDYLGLKLDELSDKTGLSKFTILKIENEETKSPYMETIQEIADAFGVTFDFIRNGSKQEWKWNTAKKRLEPPKSVILKEME